MKKSMKTALIAAAGLVLAGGLLLLAAALMGQGLSTLPTVLQRISWGSGGDAASPAGTDGGTGFTREYSVPLAGLDSLEIDWISGGAELTVVPEGDAVTFTETAARPFGGDGALRWSARGGTLEISYCREPAPADLPEKTLAVRVPAALAAKLGELSFESVSASLAVGEGIACREFSFESTSGSLSAPSLSAQRAEVSSTSGDLTLSGALGGLDAETTSGRVEAATTESEAGAEGSSVSGDLRFSGFVTVKADTISGRAEAEGALQKVWIDSISGDTVLTLPADAGFTLRCAAFSGSLDCDFAVQMDGETYVCGGGGAELQVNSFSGSLKIRKAG